MSDNLDVVGQILRSKANRHEHMVDQMLTALAGAPVMRDGTPVNDATIGQLMAEHFGDGE